jgi:hypothetical protein
LPGIGILTLQDKTLESTIPIAGTLADKNSSLTISQSFKDGKNKAPGNLLLLNKNPIKLLSPFLS